MVTSQTPCIIEVQINLEDFESMLQRTLEGLNGVCRDFSRFAQSMCNAQRVSLTRLKPAFAEIFRKWRQVSSVFMPDPSPPGILEFFVKEIHVHPSTPSRCQNPAQD